MNKLGKILVVVAVMFGFSNFLSAAETKEAKEAEEKDRSLICKLLPQSCTTTTMSNGSGNEPPK